MLIKMFLSPQTPIKSPRIRQLLRLPWDDCASMADSDMLDTSSLIEFPPLGDHIHKEHPNTFTRPMEIEHTISVPIPAPTNIPDTVIDTQFMLRNNEDREKDNGNLKPAYNPNLANDRAKSRRPPLPVTSANNDKSSLVGDSSNLQTPRTSHPREPSPSNPYLSNTQTTIPLPRDRHSSPSLDQAIGLKKGITRYHIHRYDLMIKVKSKKSEDEEQEVVKKEFQNSLISHFRLTH